MLRVKLTQCDKAADKYALSNASSNSSFLSVPSFQFHLFFYALSREKKIEKHITDLLRIGVNVTDKPA